MSIVTRILPKLSMLGRRGFSAGPRETIAANILKFQGIAAAADDAALDAIVKSSPKVDASNLPPQLIALDRYLNQPVAGSAKFVKDPSAWQNMSFSDYIQAEIGREMTWPFVVGAVSVFFLFSFVLPSSLSEEGKKTSNYIKMIEGKHGHGDAHEEHHH